MATSGFFGIGEGRTYRLGAIRLTFKPVEGQGDYSVWESEAPPGSGASLHRHGYDEWHIVLDGRYEGQVGDEVRLLGPGEMMFAPAGTPHAVRNVGDGPGRQMAINSPAGSFEAFIAELSGAGAAGDGGTPDRRATDGFREIAARHGIEFIDAGGA